MDAFYPYAKRKCKACFKAYRQWWEKTFPDKVAAKHKRMWAKHRDRYLNRDRKKYQENGYHRLPDYNKYTQSWRKAHRLEYNCQARLRNAVNVGKIARPEKCSKCGYKCKAQAHHHDYSKPYDVIWLCCSCHRRLHNELKATSST